MSCQKKQPVKFKMDQNDCIEWPPGSGIIYRGDKYDSALNKLKKACMNKGDMRPYYEYYGTLSF